MSALVAGWSVDRGGFTPLCRNWAGDVFFQRRYPDGAVPVYDTVEEADRAGKVFHGSPPRLRGGPVVGHEVVRVERGFTSKKGFER